MPRARANGKVITMSYFLSRDAKPWRGVLMGTQIALTHVGGAILLAVIATMMMQGAASPSVEDLRWGQAAVLRRGDRHRTLAAAGPPARRLGRMHAGSWRSRASRPCAPRSWASRACPTARAAATAITTMARVTTTPTTSRPAAG
jgi:hypothetical protein